MPRPWAPPVAGWPVASAEQRSPFGPAPVQSLHPYYELLRPCAPLRYSGPCGVSRLDVSLGIGATGSHVPYKSLVELRAASMPDAAWAVSGHPPSGSRRQGQLPVLTSSKPLSTLHRRFACARLSQSYLPKSSSDFPQCSPPWLLTTAACGGLRSTPDCRPRRAYLHLSYSSAPSYSDSAFVTHDPFRTLVVGSLQAISWVAAR